MILAAGLVSAVPALAQGDGHKAAQNAANWEVFQKLYPPRALAAREEGAVGFKVTLDNKGSVTACEITHSSGYPRLDQETCNLVTLHAQFKAETGLAPSQVITREGMIAWRLPNGRSKLATPVAAKSDPLEKTICKKTVRIGTLAGFERTCMTQREWARQSDDEREQWQEIQGKKGSTSGN
jgi:TonB family protein